MIGPHLRNEGFFIGYVVAFSTANLSYSYFPYFVGLLEYNGQREHGVCCIFTLLPALDLHVPVYICIVSTVLTVRDDST